MANKQKPNKNLARPKAKQQGGGNKQPIIAAKKSTPFADAGSIVGQAISDITGFKAAKNVGKWLGGGIGSIFGSGDYTVLGSAPKYNVLSGSVPSFSSAHATNIICHREYLGDKFGTAAFTNVGYALNPGVSSTFPWLSTVAQNYQEYKFHGLIFEFRPLTTDYANSGVPGVVVMATNYNASQVVYSNKQQMENSEYAVSVKPTSSLMHMIECDPAQTIDPIKYIRTGSVPSGQDQRLYDLGQFQFATQGNSTSVDIGELWVSYCVEFFKPVIQNQIGGAVPCYHFYCQGADGTHPYGTSVVLSSGTIAATLDQVGFKLSWPSPPSAKWMVYLTYNGASAAVTFPIQTLTNLTGLLYFVGDTSSKISSPNSAVTATSMGQCWTLQESTGLNSVVSMTAGVAGTVTGTQLDIIIVMLDDAIIQ